MNFWKFVLNRFIMVELFTHEELHHFVGVFHQELYQMVRDYVHPLYALGGPGNKYC